MNKSEAPYSLIAKFLSNQCDSSESLKITHWRNENPSNEALYNELKDEWELVNHAISSPIIPNKNTIWKNIQAEIHSLKITHSFYTRKVLLSITGIAATIAILFGLSISYLYTTSLQEKFAETQKTTIVVPMGQKSQIELADGTKVWLNSGSRLIYSFQYNNHDRIVELEGEAFFEVVKHPDKMFIVKTGTVDINVLGTSFNVNSYQDENTVTVSLLKGRVGLYSSIDHEFMAYLEPNQEAVISKKFRNFKVYNCDAEAESVWRLNTLKFENATVEQVVKKLERWYGVHIKLENIQSEYRYWFTIKTESLSELLKSLNKLTPIEYKIDGEEVTIRYK